MFGIGTTEFLVILLVGVLVLGPEHLPKIMRTITKVMSDFRRVSTDFQRTINLEVNQEEWQREQAAKKTKKKKKPKPAPAPAAEDAPQPDAEPPAPVAETGAVSKPSEGKTSGDVGAEADASVASAPESATGNDGATGGAAKDDTAKNDSGAVKTASPPSESAPTQSAVSEKSASAPDADIPSRRPGEPPLQGGHA